MKQVAMPDLLTDDESGNDLSRSLNSEPSNCCSALQRRVAALIGVFFGLFVILLAVLFFQQKELKRIEKLVTFNEVCVNLEDPKLLDERLQAISQQIQEQALSRINSALLERLNATSGLQLDETMLNVWISVQFQKLIRDENLLDSKPDYASELNNAIMLEASNTYTEPSTFKIFGLPLWSLSSPPAHLLKRSKQLFEIYSQPWKMDGESGYFKIKFAKPILPSAFAYVHPLRSSILDENQISCAPKVIRVIGYENEASNDPINLGQFTYQIDYHNYETEFAFEKVEREITVLKFNIKANYGNPNYTCLHKIKVF